MGQLSEKQLAAAIDWRKLAKVGVKSGSKSTSRGSVDLSIEDKTASTTTAATTSDTITSSKYGADDTSTSTSAEDHQTPGLGATRTRQIRKPTLLDL